MEKDFATTYETRIAGINHNLSFSDTSFMGLVFGYCMPNPTNKYNPNAIGIYSNRNRKLGYIPDDELEEFGEWCENPVTKFVGIIMPFYNDDDEPMLFGRITFVQGAEKAVEEKIAELTQEYSQEANEAKKDFDHKTTNIKDVSTLRNSNPQENDNGGCLGVVMVGIISIITALLL